MDFIYRLLRIYLPGILCVVFGTGGVRGFQREEDVFIVSVDEQARGIGAAKLACLEHILYDLHTISDITEEAFQRATLKLKRLKLQESSAVNTDDEEALRGAVVDVAVSVDGSWLTRGYYSRHAFDSVISVDTRECLDRLYLCSTCPACKRWEGKSKTSDEYTIFFEKHFPECALSHDGSSQSIEPEGAERLFCRAMEKNNIRYTAYIGKGDSKSFQRVRHSQPYGPDVEIFREECIGHVQKRIGSRLRSLVNKKKGEHCNRTWDGILCWQDNPARKVAVQSCPAYINGFRVAGNATRKCMPNGEWFVHPILNHTWTNYSDCMTRAEPPGPINMEEHLFRIKVIYNVGYGASIVSLVTAMSLMLYFKRLHCPRNTVHINLFLSFILRAAVCFIKDNLLVEGLGLPDDLDTQPDGSHVFRKDGTHWQCKLLFTAFHYSLGANYVWIFVEGLYLHSLIFVTVFSDKSGVGRYIFIGWASPLLFITPWVMVRVLLENVLCWNTNPTSGYFWIMRAPIVVSIAVNFLFFVNIVRVLFTKLHASATPDGRRYKYRKLARSTLVLIPLFGVHYIVFVGLPDGISDEAELVKFYFEMFFNSFQGFFVASLFCFFNGEVQGEVRKKWVRWRMGIRKKSKKTARRYTSNSYFSRMRNSQQSLQSYSQSSSQEGAQVCQRCMMERRKFKVYVERCKRSNGHALRADGDEVQPMFRVTFERESGL